MAAQPKSNTTYITDISNVCIAYNGSANTKDVNRSHTITETVGKVPKVTFTHYHTVSGSYSGVKFQCQLVATDGTSCDSDQTMSWNYTTNTWVNVDPYIINNLDHIVIKNTKWNSSTSDLYYRATSDHPSTLYIDYYALDDMYALAPASTSVSYNTPSGCSPIEGLHSATINWTEPSDWGGIKGAEVSTKKYQVSIYDKSASKTVATYNNLTGTSITYTPTSGTNFSATVWTINEYGTKWGRGATLNFYNPTVSAIPSYDGTISDQNPLQSSSGSALNYNESLGTNLSTQKNFVFNLGKLSSFTFTNYGYDILAKLNYTVNSSSTTNTSDEVSTTGTLSFSADNYNDIYEFTSLTVVIRTKTNDTTVKTKDYTFSFPLSNLKVQIGTNTTLIPSYSLTYYTKSSTNYNYDYAVQIDIANKLSTITSAKFVFDIGGTSYSTVVSFGSSSSAKVDFKTYIGAKNYAGKKLNSITYSLLDASGAEQIFRYKDSLIPVFSQVDTASTPSFISKWDSPTVTMTGDLGTKNFYNTAKFSWTLPEGLKLMTVSAAINSTTISQNTNYNYTSSVLNTITEGATNGTLSVKFTDNTYGFPIDNVSITGISRASRIKFSSSSAPTSMYKYSSWDSSGNLVENIPSFILGSSNISLSNASLTYNLTLSTSTDVYVGASKTATASSYSVTYTSSGVTIYLRAINASTGTKTINYTLTASYNGTTLDTATHTSSLQVNDGNLPPFDNGTITGTLTDYFYCNGKYYLIPALSGVTLSGISSGVKVQPSATITGKFYLKANTTTIQSTQASSTTTSLNFSTPFSISSALASQTLAVTKSFTANGQTITNNVNVKASGNNCLVGWFTNAVTGFQSVPASFSGKNLTVNFNMSSVLNSEVRSSVAGSTNTLVNNFTIKVFGAQTQSTETFLISNQAFASTETQSISLTVTLSDDFFNDNGSFTISIIPSIAGKVNNTGSLVTFYTGSESASTTIITDSPDFTIRKHRIAVNRVPSVGTDLSCVEIQIPSEENYNHFISFYDEIGTPLATFDVSTNGIIIDGAIISGGTW